MVAGTAPTRQLPKQAQAFSNNSVIPSASRGTLPFPLRERASRHSHRNARPRACPSSANLLDNFLLYDGANIWVTVSPNTVSKLRAGDGAFLGFFNRGGVSTGIASDGANIWVGDGLGTTVSKF